VQARSACEKWEKVKEILFFGIAQTWLPRRGGTVMKLRLAALAVFVLFPLKSLLAESATMDRLHDAALVFTEDMQTPDQAIPQELLETAQCAVIVPGYKKGAFMFGGSYGKGFMVCRDTSGTGWSAPGAVRLEGGSFGLQVGVNDTDVVMLVMNKGGENHLLSSQFTLGADASVAAGPVGRMAKADTDATMHAEVLSWSRSHGVFAGISLNGSTLREDLDDNRALYGRTVTNREIIEKGLPAPPAAKDLLEVLRKYAGRKPTDDDAKR
jgi:lipid-binding SYLF domain-containing protein